MFPGIVNSLAAQKPSGVSEKLQVKEVQILAIGNWAAMKWKRLRDVPGYRPHQLMLPFIRMCPLKHSFGNLFHEFIGFG